VSDATLFVDTSAWSLLLRRDQPQAHPVVDRLARALAEGEDVVATGLVLQELLQGFSGPRAADSIIERFGSVELVVPSADDHVHAADLRNRCRRAGVQVSTIDALLAALCIDRSLTILTADADVVHLARTVPLDVWSPAA
jgi:predicted nucleic acid-binding protein